MSEQDGAPATGVQAPNEVYVLKRNSDDVGWEYGFLVDANNKDKVECKFCGHRSQGGIHRLKEHVANVGKNAKKCRKSTAEAKEKCLKSLEESKRKRKEQAVRELELREEVNVSRVGTEEDEVTCIGSSEPHKLGPIDKWTRAIDPKATKSESLKQQKLNKELWKERTHEVHKYIAKWVYTHGNLLFCISVVHFRFEYMPELTLITLFSIICRYTIQCL
jgi:hypothetical protein